MKKQITSIALSAIMLFSSAAPFTVSAQGQQNDNEIKTIGLYPTAWDHDDPTYSYLDKYYKLDPNDPKCEKAPHIYGYYAGPGRIEISDFLVDKYFTSETRPDDVDYDTFKGYTYYVQRRVGGKWKNVKKGYSYDSAPKIWNLKPYTRYVFRLYFPHYGDYWYGKDGFKAYSKPITVRTTPTITKIKQKKSSRTAVKFTWKKVKCAGYKVQIRDTKYNRWKTLKTIRSQNKTKVYINNLKPNKKYKFRVVPFGNVANSKYPVYESHNDLSLWYSQIVWATPTEFTIKTKKAK